MVFAAVRIASSSRLMSRSAESEAPMALSWSRRWTRSSAAFDSANVAKRKPVVVSVVLAPMLAAIAPSFDANGTHLFDVGNAGEAFLQAVLLEGAHAVVQALREHVGDTRVLLDQLLEPVGGDQQFVQAAAALETRTAALVAAHGLVEGELPAVVAVDPDPVLVHRLHRALRVGLEAWRVHELLAVLAQECREFRRLRRIGLLAGAKALRQALRQDAEQRVREVERVHAHVEQADDRFRGGGRVQRRE